MGCDIHMYTEKRVNGKWEPADHIEKDEDGCFDVPYEKRIYNERNYSMFALLAGVRNDADIIPIVEPRGLPDDISNEIKQISDRWGDDGHTHSYITLQELLDYSPEHPIKECGYMPKEKWVAFQESLKSSNPDYNLRYPYAGWANLDTGWEYHEWSIPAREISSWFFTKTLNKLNEIGKPEDVRIVFWFDN